MYFAYRHRAAMFSIPHKESNKSDSISINSPFQETKETSPLQGGKKTKESKHGVGKTMQAENDDDDDDDDDDGWESDV